MNNIESKELDKLFDVIFLKGTTYRQFISSTQKNKMLVVQSQVNLEKDLLPDPSKSNLRFTYENYTNNLYEEIVKITNESCEFLYLSTYSIVGLDSLPEFSEAIISAVNRGVKVNLFCRGMNYRNDHLMGAEKLHSFGCKITADLFNHSKGIINEKSGMIFTANIDGNHGLKNGFEVGCVLTEKQRLKFIEIHEHLIQTSYYVFQNKPLREDLFKTYTEYETTKGITAPSLPNELIVSLQNGIVNDTKLFFTYPIFFGRSKESHYLIIGEFYFKCKIDSNIIQIFERCSPRFDIERYILKFNNLTINIY